MGSRSAQSSTWVSPSRFISGTLDACAIEPRYSPGARSAGDGSGSSSRTGVTAAFTLRTHALASAGERRTGLIPSHSCTATVSATNSAGVIVDRFEIPIRSRHLSAATPDVPPRMRPSITHATPRRPSGIRYLVRTVASIRASSFTSSSLSFDNRSASSLGVSAAAGAPPSGAWTMRPLDGSRTSVWLKRPPPKPRAATTVSCAFFHRWRASTPAAAVAAFSDAAAEPFDGFRFGDGARADSRDGVAPRGVAGADAGIATVAGADG